MQMMNDSELVMATTVGERPPDDASDMLWSVADVKRHFGEYKMWPQFVGAIVNVNKPGDTSLPVVLWREQVSYISKNKDKLVESSKLPAGFQSRKRGRELISTSNSANSIDELSESETKKPRHRNYLTSAIVSVVSSVSTWFSKNLFNLFAPSGKTVIINDEVTSIKTDLTILEGCIDRDSFTTCDMKATAEESPLLVPMDSQKTKRRVKRQSQASVIREKTFATLQDMGYFVGPGDIYGGEYTLYANGDPAKSHSTATVRICPNASISLKEFLAFTRVQNQVAKSGMLAYIKPSYEPGSDMAKLHAKRTERMRQSFQELIGPITVDSDSAVDKSQSIIKSIADSDVGFITAHFKGVSTRA